MGLSLKTKKATARWTRNLQDEIAVRDFGCYFDEVKGCKAVNFFEKHLRHSKGKKWAGARFKLMDWQRDRFVMPLFGWMRADGTRRFRKAYIEVPKKNGKSSIFSGFALFLLTFDGEPGAEVYSAAADREQASIIYREAKAMALQSPDLRKRLKIIDSQKRIEYPGERGQPVYRVLSRESGTAEGLNIHGLLFDELHAQKSRGLWDTLTFGGASRSQPLLASITTAGFDQETICWEEHEYARQVLDGVTEDFAYFALIYAADPGDDWADPAVWRKANPSLGVTIDEAEFGEECARALAEPRKLNSFLRYRLNIWTQQNTAWLNPEAWAACAAEYTREDLVDGE